jgi:hypothetical protein
MADRICVTSVILGSLPRGERLVSLGGGRRLARSGLIDRRAQAEVRSALKSDTPTANWFSVLRVSVSSTEVSIGSSGRGGMDSGAPSRYGGGPKAGARPPRYLGHFSGQLSARRVSPPVRSSARHQTRWPNAGETRHPGRAGVHPAKRRYGAVMALVSAPWPNSANWPTLDQLMSVGSPPLDNP